jgi:hypothetical protein
MKAAGREFLRDLKAAAALGTPEALDLALLGLRNLPEVRGNQALDSGSIEKLLLPAGEMLGEQRVPYAYLEELSHDHLAAIRALPAAAFVLRTCRGSVEGDEVLIRLAADARPEVRRVLALASRECAAEGQTRPLTLASSWLTEPVDPKKAAAHARRQATALEMLVNFTRIAPQAVLAAARGQKQNPDPDVRAALAGLLVAAGQSGQTIDVLDLLEMWAADAEPNEWVICRVLSAHWAANTSGRAAAILDALEASLGLTSSITNARRALARKGENPFG